MEVFSKEYKREIYLKSLSFSGIGLLLGASNSVFHMFFLLKLNWVLGRFLGCFY